MDFLRNHIECLIFSAESPISIEEIQTCMSEMFDAEVSSIDIEDAVKELQDRYSFDEFAIQIVNYSNGFQFLTKPAYQASISILFKNRSKKKLSASAIEALSIIAYRQPVSKSEIEMIRGVNSDYSVKRLLDNGLIEIKGKSDSVGRPLIFGTTPKFLDYIGLSDISHLPQLKDLGPAENEIGETQE